LKKDNKKKANITVKDIADSINISASTVSRALNNHPKISQTTKEKVWAAAKKLGYQPNIPAYMNPENSKTICFLVPEIDNAFYIDTLRVFKTLPKTIIITCISLIPITLSSLKNL